MMKQDKTASIYGWDNCPESLKARVGDIAGVFRNTLAGSLTGIYLHGSLAMGCFNPEISDIDFLVVVDQKLTIPQKQEIIKYLTGSDTGKASPEMSIVTTESLTNIVYPSPFELHYSNSFRAAYASGGFNWEEQRFDTDLAAHYMSVRERSVCLYGKPAKETIPEIPPEMFIASLVQDLHWLRQEISRIPFRQVVLNPCRAMAYASENRFMSKMEGGQWAITHLPPKYSILIESALNDYAGAPGGADKASPPSQDTLTEFIDYAVKEFICLAAKTDAENLFFKRSY
jgi:predicted nucleotidyltransferase